MKDQKKSGALISYLNIVLGMVSNFLLIPMMITALADVEYSVYKIMQSLAGPLIMLNLGISTIAARAVVRYRSGEHGDRKEKENTLAMTFGISCIMALAVLVLGLLICGRIPALYGNTYDAAMLEKARKIFLIFAGTMAVRIVNDTFKGCILGNERFLCFYGESAVQNVLHFALIAILLKNGADAVAVAMVDLVICLGLLLFNALYTCLRLSERFRLEHLDYGELKQIALFSVSILLQAIVNQVNNNLDVVILGMVVTDKTVITMYASALSVYAIYNSVMSVFVNIYFPKAARMVMNSSTGEELTDFVIGPGRFQAVLAVGILTAFSLFGKDFIGVWIGSRYESAYYIALMLMIPVTVPLVQNTCLSILDAQLKRLFRSVTLVIMALINVAVSLVLIRFLGFWGAALGTVVSLVLGHVVIMNVYYHRVLGLNVVRMFREIFRGILPAGMVSGLCCLPLCFLPGEGIVPFLGECGVFLLVYAGALWCLGLNPGEKAALKAMKKYF